MLKARVDFGHMGPDGRLTSVHSHTTHRWPDVEPPAATGLTKLAVLVVGVAGDADGGASILVHPPDLTTLQLHVHIHARHDLGAVGLGLLLFADDGSVRTRAATEDGGALESRTDVEHHSPHGDEVDGQAVPPEDGLGGKNTGIDDTTHAVEEALRDTGAVAVHYLAGAHAVGGDDVRFPPCCLFCDEGDMGTPAGVVLDPVDDMGAGPPPIEIDGPNPALRTASPMPHCDSPVHVAASLPVTPLRERQGQMGSALPQVVVDRTPQVSHTRCPGLVGPDDGSASRRLLSGPVGVGPGRGISARRRGARVRWTARAGDGGILPGQERMTSPESSNDILAAPAEGHSRAYHTCAVRKRGRRGTDGSARLSSTEPSQSPR